VSNKKSVGKVDERQKNSRAKPCVVVENLLVLLCFHDTFSQANLDGIFLVKI